MLKIDHFSFAYPNQPILLKDVCLEVEQGDFVVITGVSGSGKSTLLKQIKPAIAPYGTKTGNIYLEGKEIESYSEQQLTSKIGFVSQKAENQVVTDKVWHELAFGLESPGIKSQEIRFRVAEMATFFGISDWFQNDVDTLSGGQLQKLCLASVVIMRPDIILLDEPLSTLDPISAIDFIQFLNRVNQELNTTIILVEHNLSDVYPYIRKLVYMEEGKILTQGNPQKVINFIEKYPVYNTLPANVQIQNNYGLNTYDNDISCFRRIFHDNFIEITEKKIETSKKHKEEKPILELKNVYFRYNIDKEILKDINMKIYPKELKVIMGANGSGKSTLLGIIAGLYSKFEGKRITKCKVRLLTQDPEILFTKRTVEEDLKSIESNLYEDVIHSLDLKPYLSKHPYDLSGGEQQLVAFAKVLLTDADIYLLDEPTKGMDWKKKELVAETMKRLLTYGKSFIVVSHDMEFCANHSEQMLFMFQGEVITEGFTRDLLLGNAFYTTSLNRVLCNEYHNLLVPKDVEQFCIKR